ncbi:MAG TPA: hypothetical protein DDY74_09185 [Pseudothermotoga sp.]|jgi:gluconokinase|nr:MAG: Carbohydrate kinase FGGY [Pseudothermotoga lettingae]MDK2885120.1 gluconokinase [Pseudothermotoga sp.]HBJ82034.1 hypothetical protein [Pseudothermotoga sp.]HBT26736.1 hypothetical protein [Pseudothermotoga sp.]
MEVPRAMEMYIGVDIGTTAVKTIVYNSDAKKIEMDVSQSYEAFSKGHGQFEQDPRQIERAVFETLKQVSKSFTNVRAIVLDSALHTVMLLNGDFEPLSNVIPWLDERSVDHVKKVISDNQLSKHLHLKTGCPPDTVYPLYKLLWIKQNEKDMLNSASKIVSLKDYVIYKLTGDLVSDIGVASGSGYMDIEKKVWCEELLKDFLEISSEKLPQLVSPKTVLRLSKEAAKITGLPEGLPVVVGISDAAASSIGAGAFVENSITISVGSSAAIRAVLNHPVKQYPVSSIWCYVLDENHYISGAAIKNGGYVFDWYVKLFCCYDHETIVKKVEENLNFLDEKPVLFYPFIFGKRFPEFDPSPRAKFDNLTSTTTQEQVARSVLEGIAFNLKRAFDVVKTIPDSLEKVFATGGLTRATVWMKMLSAILNHPILVQSKRQGAALGTILYFLSKGDLHSIGGYLSNNEVEIFRPDRSLFEYYSKLYRMWVENF